MRRRRNRPRPCPVQPAFERESACHLAIARGEVDLPAGTRGQSVWCGRCHQWHVAPTPLSAQALRMPPATLRAMCLRKVRYQSEGAALVAALRRPVGLRIYFCPLCMGWHLTKQKRGTDERAA
jgi:hypothetical protein